MVKKSLKNWALKNKIWLIIYGLLIILIFLFLKLKLTNISFDIISAFINVFLIHILYETTKVLKIKWSKKEITTMSLVVLSIYIFYIISLVTRNFIYYWDYSCYYNIQIDTIDRFNQGLLIGIKSLVTSTWGGEYGNFLSFIVQLPFSFTNKTPNSYVASSILLFAPYIIYSLSLLLKKLILFLKIKRKEIVFGLTIISFSLMPLFYSTSIYGQPDIFGLFFIFLIVALTINYDFKKVEYNRLTLLFLITYMLFITRRWYIFWIISYLACYGVIVMYMCFKDKKNYKKTLKHILVYLLICIAIFLLTLFPLFKNIIINDYSSHYIYYYKGGLFKELGFQFGHIGISLFIFLFIGAIIGLIDKKYRKIAIVSIVQIFIIIVLFNRIQNMGLHHTLTLLPAYLCFIFVFIAFISTTRWGKIVYPVMILIMTLNFSSSIIGIDSKLFSDAKIIVPYQEDYEEIGMVVDWLEKKLDNNHRAYMITHTNKYNPDKFRSYHLPDRTIKNYLPYGSSIIGVHKFPIELFTSSYVITTSPFEKKSVDEKYEKVFNELVNEGKFELIEDFDMNNGYHVLIYERIKPVDLDEINMYEIALKEESKQFKELYEDILEDYKTNL